MYILLNLCVNILWTFIKFGVKTTFSFRLKFSFQDHDCTCTFYNISKRMKVVEVNVVMHFGMIKRSCLGTFFMKIINYSIFVKKCFFLTCTPGNKLQSIVCFWPSCLSVSPILFFVFKALLNPLHIVLWNFVGNKGHKFYMCMVTGKEKSGQCLSNYVEILCKEILHLKLCIWKI